MIGVHLSIMYVLSIPSINSFCRILEHNPADNNYELLRDAYLECGKRLQQFNCIIILQGDITYSIAASIGVIFIFCIAEELFLNKLYVLHERAIFCTKDLASIRVTFMQDFIRSLFTFYGYHYMTYLFNLAHIFLRLYFHF